MDYTILILVLPVLSFLVLGLTGMFMKHRVAGLIGTASLLGVTILSYLTAFKYFMSPRTADGVYPTLTPWNIEWLPFTDSLHIDMGILLDPLSVMMLVGAHLFFRLHERRERFSALLRLPFTLYVLYAGVGSCHQHISDVCILGVGRCFFLPPHRLLLY